ncbi:MAG: hypothetical protein AAF423_10795 [Pseudomonadota bacterium]
MAAKHSFENLTKAETELLRATKAGEVALANKFDKNERIVRPELIRWLAENSHDREVVAVAGIRLLYANIEPGPIDLNNLDIAVPLWLRYCKLERLELRDARTKEIDLDSSTISNGVDAEGAQVDGGWFMLNAEVDGIFDICVAKLNGEFQAHNAKFRNTDEKAVQAFEIEASNWHMNDAEVDGVFDINGAKLSGQFNSAGTKFRHAGGVAVQAQSLEASTWFMRGKTSNTDPCIIEGQLDLNATKIKQIDLDETQIIHTPGVAIRLDRSRIDQSLSLTSGFSSDGAIVLDGAVCSGRVRLLDAELTCDLALAKPYNPEKAGSPIITERYWRHRTHAISAVGAKIDRLHLPKERTKGVIDLSQAKIGTLIDEETGWFPTLEPGKTACDERLCVTVKNRDGEDQTYDLQHIVLDGTTYEHLDHPDGKVEAEGRNGDKVWKARERWLKGQSAGELTRRFNPQPWRQLARTLAGQGYEEDARHIAIQRRVAQRKVEPQFGRRMLSGFLHHVSDYGFNPWRTVRWSLITVLLCGLIFAVSSGEYWFGTNPERFIETIAGDVINLESKSENGEPLEGVNIHYPEFNPWLYSLDQFIPILNLGMDTYWRPDNRWLYILSVFEQLLGAVLVALTITGFTGLLTRDENL